MPKDKLGNQLTWKEYMDRWKEGCKGVTQLQQLNIQYKSNFISLFGIAAGIIICLYSIKTLWWLLLILVGAFGNMGVVQLGLWQKKIMFEQIEKNIIEMQKEVKENVETN